MINVTVDDSGVREILATLEGMPEKLRLAQRNLLLQAGAEVSEEYLRSLRSEIPVRRPLNPPDPRQPEGGEARDRLRKVRTSITGRTIEYEFRTVGHIKYVLTGTGPHEISPREGTPKLVFYGRTVPGLHFRDAVHHPGINANLFPDRAWQKSKYRISAILEQAVKDIKLVG